MLKRSSISFKGYLTSSESLRAVTVDTLLYMPPRHQTTKYTSSSKQISTRCRKDSRAVLWPQGAVLGATQHCMGFLSHHRGENAAMRLENSFQVLYDNQNRLGLFKAAPDGHLVMYF